MYESEVMKRLFKLKSERTGKTLPFEPLLGQEILFDNLFNRLHNPRDVRVERDRQAGFTWGISAFLAYRMIFGYGENYAVVARTNHYASKIQDNVDFILCNLPFTCRPTRSDLRIYNNESCVNIYFKNSQSDTCKGNRLTMMFFDDFDCLPVQDQDTCMRMSRDVTKTRVFGVAKETQPDWDIVYM